VHYHTAAGCVLCVCTWLASTIGWACTPPCRTLAPAEAVSRLLQPVIDLWDARKGAVAGERACTRAVCILVCIPDVTLKVLQR
jgi:hypothetical protein